MHQPQRLQHQLQRNLFPNQPMTLVSVILGVRKNQHQQMTTNHLMNHSMLALMQTKKKTLKNSLNNLLEN
jgi:hypothetical protein